MRRRCPWRKPVVFMRRSAWIEEELLVYFTCTHTYTYIYIYIPTKKPASEGKPPRLVKPATAETDTKTDGLQAFWSKKKEKEKLVARLKSKHISLRLHDNVSRDEFGRYNYLCSCARVPAFSNAPPFLSFLWSPLEEGGPFEFFFEKNPNTLLQRPRFSNLFFFYSTEKVKSPRNCARALKSSA